MLDLDLSGLLAAKGGRPLGVIVAVAAIFLPSSLLVYFTRPDLYQRYGIAGGIFFGAAVGLPVVFVCCWPYSVLVWPAVKQEEIRRRIPEAFGTLPPRPPRSATEKMLAEDPFEWPVSVTRGWTGNIVLYCLVAIAYYRPLRLGATLLLTVGIVLAMWLLLAVLLVLGIKRLERITQTAIENARKEARP
jgi:hypothetical protein